MTLFMRLAQLMRDTPSLSSVDLYETDLTRIAMLLLDFMDGIAVSDTWRAGLVVNCGVEQVLFARDRIERFLPFIRIARVIPESEEAGGSTALDGLHFSIFIRPNRNGPARRGHLERDHRARPSPYQRHHSHHRAASRAGRQARRRRPPRTGTSPDGGRIAPRCPASRTHQGESVGGHRRGVPQDLRDVLIHLRRRLSSRISRTRRGEREARSSP